MAAIKRIKRELQGLDPDAQQNLGLFVWGDDLHRLLGWIKVGKCIRMLII